MIAVRLTKDDLHPSHRYIVKTEEGDSEWGGHAFRLGELVTFKGFDRREGFAIFQNSERDVWLMAPGEVHPYDEGAS
jgi:hypothetical protein